MDLPKKTHDKEKKAMGLSTRLKQAWKKRKGAKSRPKVEGEGSSLTSNRPESSALTTTKKPSGMDPPSDLQRANVTTDPQSTTSDVNPFQPTDEYDTWTRAFNIIYTREKDLVEDYMKHLVSLQPNSAVDVQNPVSWPVKSIAEQLLNDRKEKQWKVSLFGNEVRIREQSERLVKFLLWTEPVAKAAASTQPCGALAWSGVSLLLPLLTSGTAANEAMLKGFNSVCNTQFYWNLFENKYLEPSRQASYRELLEQIAELYSHIVEYQARVICYLSRAQLSRAWQTVAGWNDWNGKEEEITSLSDHCRQCLGTLEAEKCQQDRDHQLQKMVESQAILDKIRTALKTSTQQNQTIYDDKNERELLRNLASDYEDDKNFNPTRVAGTCEWFFANQDFCKWRNSSTSNLLWLSAGPGCGKSVLSRTLIEEERLSTNISTSTVCYFFFKDGVQGRMHATDALGAILHQLFMHDSTGKLIRHAMHSHKSYGKSLTQSLSEMWRILLNCSSEAGEIVCVLDALDECTEDSWRDLIKLLNEFYCPPNGSSLRGHSLVKFLITSRPYANLELSFRGFSGTSAYMRFDGDEMSPHIGRDIDLVIDAQVDIIASDFEECDRKKISKRLKNMENRTYLWLHLTFDIIKKNPSQYDRRCDIEHLLSDIPDEVSGAYENILNRSSNRDLTEILLQIILSAVRPLTLDEVNIALTIASNKQRFDSRDNLMSHLWPRSKFKSTVKNLCGLFISVYDSKLSFIHLTAREFLINPERQGIWQGRFSISNSHKTMSLICLNDLSYLDDQWPEYKITSEFPLVTYFKSHCMDHAKPVVVDEEVQIKILEFFLQQKPAFKAWVDLMSKTAFTSTIRLWHFEVQNLQPLHCASFEGFLNIVKILLCNDKSDNANTEYLGVALCLASIQGHRDIVQLLLENSADVNIATERVGTALQAASIGGHKETVQLLLENGADVNITTGRVGTALQAASIGGHKETAQLLLENGADVNIITGWVGTALRAASIGGHKETAQLLLENSADVNITTERVGTALQAASIGGHKETAQLLLENGADVNITTEPVGTALQAASIGGHKETVQLLLENGADVNIITGWVGTALRAASIGGHKEIIQLLLENSADVNIITGWAGTALQAASEGGHKEIIQLLLENGADVNITSEGLGTALRAASERGYKETVQLLLENGADVNITTKGLGTALQAASIRGHMETVQLLLENGADVNTETILLSGQNIEYLTEDTHTVQLLLGEGAEIDDDKKYPFNVLQIVCLKCRKDMAQILLDNGADVNSKEGFCSALQAACLTGNKDIIQLLLGKGADVNAIGQYPLSPLEIVHKVDNEEIIQLLIRSGARSEAVPLLPSEEGEGNIGVNQERGSK